MSSSWGRAAAVLSLSLAIGCGDDAGDEDTGPASGTAPMMAMNLQVYNGDDSTTYVNALPTLEIPGVDVKKALEFTGGRATMAAIENKLYVADPAQPLVRRYQVSDAGKFTLDGEISFANFGTDETSLDEWGNIFLSPTKAYLRYSGKMIVWNPTALQIVKEIDLSALPNKEGANWSRDGGGMIARGNRLYHTMYWNDWDAWKSSPESYLVTFDTDTDTLLSAQRDDRCPALGNRPDRDEAGNIYFSNWIWNIPETVRHGAPKSCVLRLPVGADKYDDWKLTYSDLTQGREGSMFSILPGGKATMSVFHTELAKNEPSMTDNEFASQDVWKVWSIDLATNTAAPIETIPVNSGAASVYHIDGKHFIYLPTEGWAKTHVYELAGVTSRKLFEATGWSYQLIKLR